MDDDYSLDDYSLVRERLKMLLSVLKQGAIDTIQLVHEKNESKEAWKRSAAKQTLDEHQTPLMIKNALYVYNVIKSYERDPTSFLVLKQEDIEEAIRVHNEVIQMLDSVGIVLTFTFPKFV